MYCHDIEWQSCARLYREGVRLITAATRRVPAQALSPNAKSCNKMSQMVALNEVQAVDAQVWPLMLDINGMIAETHSHNFLFVSDGVLRTPSLRNCLPGITRAVTLELARSAGIPVEEGEYTVFDVYNADEAFITSTSFCIICVTSLDGVQIGSELPGPVGGRLIEAWRQRLGLDFMVQAWERVSARE